MDTGGGHRLGSPQRTRDGVSGKESLELGGESCRQVRQDAVNNGGLLAQANVANDPLDQ